MEIIRQEKRRYPRMYIKTPLRCQVRGKKDYYNTLSSDIGLGGVSFVNDDFIAPGTLVNFELNILSRMLAATGKIVATITLPYSDKFKLGLEFLDLASEEKKFLSEYIEARKQQTD